MFADSWAAFYGDAGKEERDDGGTKPIDPLSTTTRGFVPAGISTPFLQSRGGEQPVLELLISLGIFLPGAARNPSLHFGLAAADPFIFASSDLTISAAILACHLPARRANRVDSISVL